MSTESSRHGYWGLDGPETRVVLSDMDLDGRAVLAVPLLWALADLTTFATFQHAETFDDARRDPLAAALIEDGLPGYLEQLGEQGVEPRVQQADPWDAEQFFGMDQAHLWRPNAREATADFLLELGGQAEALLQEDPGTNLNCELHPFVPVNAQPLLDAVLTGLGYQVTQWQGLALAYNDSPRDVVDLLSLLR